MGEGDPIGRDHHSGLQREQIANTKVANRHADIELDRQLCDSLLDAEAGSSPLPRLRSHQSVDSSRLVMLGDQMLRRRRS